MHPQEGIDYLPFCLKVELAVTQAEPQGALQPILEITKDSVGVQVR